MVVVGLIVVAQPNIGDEEDAERSLRRQLSVPCFFLPSFCPWLLFGVVIDGSDYYKNGFLSSNNGLKVVGCGRVEEGACLQRNKLVVTMDDDDVCW